MKRKIGIIAMSSLIGVSLIGTVFSTLSWFDNYLAVPDNKIDGQVEGAYFAYGDGLTPKTAYGITKYRHMYNLAWLQYLGRFKDKQYYFELGDNVDMGGIAIPPIGTTQYPFIGQFNGQNYEVSNFTVSNDFTDLKLHPSNLSSIDSNVVKIVGVFGVVGDYPDNSNTATYDSKVNSIESTGFNNFTVRTIADETLIGMVAGYVDATISCVAVDNATVDVVEGAENYSDSLTTNISNHSLIGYATESALQKCYLNNVEADLPQIDNPNTVSGGQQWGGSIDMKTVYTRLREIRDSSEILGYYETETRKDGAHVSDGSFHQIYEQVGREYYREEGKQLRSDGRIYASFNFRRYATNANFSPYGGTEPTTSNVYALMTGERTFSYTKTIYNSSSSAPTKGNSFKICVGAACLSASGSTIATNSEINSSVSWTWDSNGRLSYTTSGYGSTTYYLYRNNNSLALTNRQNTASVWQCENGRIYTTEGNQNYYLSYSELTNSWSLRTTTDTTTGNYYVIGDGAGNYFSNSNTTIQSTNSVGSATKWSYSNNRFSTLIGNTTYYLSHYYRRNWGNRVELNTNPSGTYTVPYRPTNSISSSVTTSTPISAASNSTYYLVRSGSTWSYSTSSVNLYVIPVTVNTADSRVSYSSGSTTQAAEYHTYPTYFPLLMHPSTYEPMNGYQADPKAEKQYNTGYIASGTNVHTGDDSQDASGDVRFAGYPYDASGDAPVTDWYGNTTVTDSLYKYTNNKKIYTRNNYLNGKTIGSNDWGYVDGTTATFDGVDTRHLQKIKKSYPNLVQTLSESADEGHVYGVHFMDCAITKDKLVTVETAKVLDKPAVYNEETQEYEDHISTYDDYEVPQDSIDFHLKSAGYINFYAGTFYTANNAFFSLHKITRKDPPNESQIESIQHITKIYAPDYKDNLDNYKPADAEHPYIYEYTATNGTKTYVAGEATVSKPDEDFLLFDSSWIENPNAETTLEEYSVYYFEIPVNAGEYALGSVDGKSGAYLIYLDIGAGTANFKDVNIVEHITFSYTDVSFPKGIDFADLSGSGDKTKISAIVGGESAHLKILSANVGIVIKYSYATDANTSQSALTLTKSGNDPPDTPQAAFALSYEQYNVTTTYKSEYEYSPTDAAYSIELTREIAQSFNPSVGTGTQSILYHETYEISSRPQNTKIQLPTIGPTTGVDAASWTATGSATVSAGLVTFTSTGEATVESTWTTSEEVGDDWKPFDSNNASGTETDPILQFHFLDYSKQSDIPPNVVISFVYSETGNDTEAKTFYYDVTVNNTCSVPLHVIIDALKNAYESEGESTYVIRINYGEETTVLTLGSSPITIPNVSSS